ncbi:hypothetical protein G6R29_03840 [Fructobacillus sp. M2-14]|uniref:Uncharacterized protein n=1 Tax=Fructobacillus broussonetiae TaxID=2713173 RepID=A0ABS5QZY0_9LACO|nr:hypothetical protein [Fructobacillus broussonetiae]MBS9338755.1 hypothetical protein [Fructobacillus broussonetiae]
MKRLLKLRSAFVLSEAMIAFSLLTAVLFVEAQSVQDYLLKERALQKQSKEVHEVKMALLADLEKVSSE